MLTLTHSPSFPLVAALAALSCCLLRGERRVECEARSGEEQRRSILDLRLPLSPSSPNLSFPAALLTARSHSISPVESTPLDAEIANPNQQLSLSAVTLSRSLRRLE